MWVLAVHEFISTFTFLASYVYVCLSSPSVTSCVLLAVYYEGLQDKLAQVRDARAALDALRDEHREKLRRAAEEAERQRQIQLAQKLEIMRQKKQVIKGGSPLANAVINKHFNTILIRFVLTVGVPGNAKTVGHPASPGAGEREADASGAAEAYNPDESPNACIFSSLYPGTIDIVQHQMD